MADNRTSGKRRQSNRLRGRAPASIQVNRSPDWNVAIPLLSPLIQSPTSPESCNHNQTAEVKPAADTASGEKKERQQPGGAATSFKKWQHPAAPFCYEPAPFCYNDQNSHRRCV